MSCSCYADRMKRAGLLAVGLVICLLQSGCWDRKEVNDLALVTAAAIDKSSTSGIELSVQLFIPRGGGGQSMGGGGGGEGGGTAGQTFVRSASGRTIADAMMRLQEKLPRRIFWGHNEILIFSSEVAREGLKAHVDFMVRYPQVRESSFLFICQSNAKKLLELHSPLERSSSEVLRELATSKIGIKVKLKDVLERLQGDAEAVGLPWVEEQPPQPGMQPNENAPYITGTAVVKKGKLVGRINDELTRGVLWVRNEIDQAMVTVSPAESKGYVTLKLLHAHTRLTPFIQGNQWQVTLNIETEDDIVLNGTRLNLMNPTHTRRLEEDIQDEIHARVRQTLDEVQTGMKADIFGFADAFHRKYPREWKKAQNRWDEQFPEIEVRCVIRAHVRRPGMNAGPATVPEKDVIQ